MKFSRIGKRAVDLVEPFREVVARLNGFVVRRPLGAAARRKALDHRVVIGPEKERDRIALSAGSVDDPVRRRGKKIVRPSREHLTEVDDERVWDGLDVHPFSMGALDLKTADFAWVEDGEALVVAMSANAEIALVDAILGRIVE